MSDTSQGPGWWQASDGKWYPPELYPTDWPKPNPATQASEPAAEPAEAAVVDVADVAPAITEAPAHAAPPADPAPAAEPSPAHGMPAVTEPPPVADPSPAFGTPAVAEQAPAAATFTPSAAEAAAEWAEPAPVPIAGEPSTPTAFGSPSPSTQPNQWGADPATAEPTLPGGVPVVDAPPVTQSPPITQSQPVVDATATTQVPSGPPDTWGHAEAAPLGRPVGTEETTSAAGDMPSGILGIIGGLALVVGSFLAWATAGGTLTSGNVNGLSGSNGWGTLICGLVVASGAALLFAGLRRWWVGAGMTVAALVAAGLVIFSIIDIGSTSDDLPGVLRDAGVEEATAAGAKLDLDVGIWIVAAGAAVSVIAGIVALVRRDG